MTHTLEICRPAGCAYHPGVPPYTRPGKLQVLCDGAPDFIIGTIYTNAGVAVYSRSLVLNCGCNPG